MLDQWIAAAARELGVEELDVDTRGLLDMTRTVAHGVARPAAPLTAFLVGYAAAKEGGGPEAVARATRTVEALAARWEQEQEQEQKEQERQQPGGQEPGR